MKNKLFIISIVLCVATIISLVVTLPTTQQTKEPVEQLPQVQASDVTVEGYNNKAVFSGNGEILLIEVPYNADYKMSDLSNDISKAYSDGFELVGVTSTDTGIAEAHFRNILVFHKRVGE